MKKTVPTCNQLMSGPSYGRLVQLVGVYLLGAARVKIVKKNAPTLSTAGVDIISTSLQLQNYKPTSQIDRYLHHQLQQQLPTPTPAPTISSPPSPTSTLTTPPHHHVTITNKATTKNNERHQLQHQLQHQHKHHTTTSIITVNHTTSNTTDTTPRSTTIINNNNADINTIGTNTNRGSPRDR